MTHIMIYTGKCLLIYVPVLQRECDIFVNNWNNHRIRSLKGLEVPTGVPNHLFSFPERYGAEKMGFPLHLNTYRRLQTYLVF